MFNSLKRNCSAKYIKIMDDNKNNPEFKTKDDINNFLKFNLSPSCFEIITYSELKKRVGNNNDENKHFINSCVNGGEIPHKNQQKIVDEAIELLKFDDSMYPNYHHFVIVKSVSKGIPVALSHIIFEISENKRKCTIHYICKCTDTIFSSSCALKKLSSLLIYYTAFYAKENGCSTLELLSDSDGGEKLKNYYESMNFSERQTVIQAWGSRKINDDSIFYKDTPMELDLNNNLKFNLKPLSKQKLFSIQDNNSTIKPYYPNSVQKGGENKKKEVLYNSKKYKVCKDGRMNYITVGVNKNKVYLKNIPGKYKKLS
jgi:hypothetical protein